MTNVEETQFKEQQGKMHETQQIPLNEGALNKVALNKRALVKLTVGLCISNTIMMAAWFLLLSVQLPTVLAILLSWGMACIEYIFHVSANRSTHEELGLIRLRGANEVVNYLAFLAICAVTEQPLYSKYSVVPFLLAIVVYVFILSDTGKRWRAPVATGVAVCCAVAVTWLRVPEVIRVTSNSQPVLIGGLPLILFAGCFVANSFMIMAWYTHLKLKPSAWFEQTARKRWLFSWLVSCGIALLEYSILIPVNRASYAHVSMMALFGYMEISTVTVFLLFAYRSQTSSDESFRLKSHHVIGFSLLVLIEVSFCIF